MNKRVSKFLALGMAIVSVLVYSQVSANQADMDPTFNTKAPINFGQYIESIIVQSGWKMIMWGWFTTYRWITSNYIVGINADGTIDSSFNIGWWFNALVMATVKQSDDKIIIGGNFTTYSWSTVNHIVRLNADGTIDTGFTIWSWFDSNVNVIKIQSDNKIVIAWDFINYNWTDANRIIRLNADGTIDTGFIIWSWFNNRILDALDIETGGKILVGWRFTWYNWVITNGIVRLNSNGSLDTGFTIWSWFNGSIITIKIQNDWKILVWGAFTNYSGTTANRLIRLNNDWTKDTGFNIWGWFNDTVSAIWIQSDNKIIIIGPAFLSWVLTNWTVRLNSDGSKDTGYVVGWGHGSYAHSNGLFFQNDGKLIVGWAISLYSWTKVNYIFRANTWGSLDRTFMVENYWFDGEIFSLAKQSDWKIIVWWSFLSYSWADQRFIGRMNANWTFDDSFNIWIWFIGTTVYTIAVQNDDKLLVGGAFTSYNWVTGTNIVRLNADGTRDSSFVVGGWFNGGVSYIAIDTWWKALVAGSFTAYSGTTANKILRINTDGTIDTGFNAVGWCNVTSSAIWIQSDGKIVVGGQFTTFSGVSSNRIVRINADGTRDASFVVGWGFDGIVNTLAIQNDGKIVVGGSFTTYSGQVAKRIARLNSDGSLDTWFSWTWFNNTVNTVAIQTGGQIIVWWRFTMYSGENAVRIIRLNADGTKNTNFDALTWFDQTVDTVLIWDIGQIIVGGYFTTYNWLPAAYLTQLYGDKDVIVVPNSTNQNTVFNEFTNKWYTLQNDGNLSGSKSFSLELTEGDIPVWLNLINKEIKLSIPENTQFVKADNITVYTGVIAAPTLLAINSINDQTVLSAFKVGSTSESLKMLWAVATLTVPVPGATIGSVLEISYSEDNGITRNHQTSALVTSDANGNAEVIFTTNHFTNFSVTVGENSFTGSLVINNNDASTTSSSVSINMTTNPSPNNMRFSNDGITRSSWEAYTNIKSWTLSEVGTDTKTVFAQFDTDNNTNTAEISTSDTIEYLGGGSGGWDGWSNGGQSNWGAWGSGTPLAKDICSIKRDCSSSYYDNLCGPCTKEDAATSKINIATQCTAYSNELNGAYAFAFNNWITTINNCTSANLNGTLIRSHLAKMASQFAIKTLKMAPDTTKSCIFSDMQEQTTEMQFYSKVACQLWLMGLQTDWVTQNDNFYPDQEVDRGQFGTILSRLLRGTKNNGGTVYYQKHLDALKTEGIMKKIDTPNEKEIRGWVMLMLQRSVK